MQKSAKSIKFSLCHFPKILRTLKWTVPVQILPKCQLESSLLTFTFTLPSPLLQLESCVQVKPFQIMRAPPKLHQLMEAPHKLCQLMVASHKLGQLTRPQNTFCFLSYLHVSHVFQVILFSSSHLSPHFVKSCPTVSLCFMVKN